MRKFLFLVPILLSLSCQTPVKNVQADLNETSEEKARRLSQEILLIDTHIDLPNRLATHWDDISKKTDAGHFDYVRAREGGLNAPFMAIYVAPDYQKSGGAKEKADELIDLTYDLANRWPDVFAIATSPHDLQSQFEDGLMSLPMGIENGAAIEDDLGNLKYFKDRGISYLTLCHSKWNEICDSSYDPDKHWNGLSPFGRETVKEMNRLGMIIDISHVSDSAFYQVLEVSAAPLIASHSSCRHFTPEFERNMSDDMIIELAAHGGVIQINFGSYFINGEFQSKMSKAWEHVENRSEMTSEERNRYLTQYMKDHNVPKVYLEEVADHIDHVVQLVGINYVGIGSDFDGVDHLPEGLSDVSQYPTVLRLLLERGYTEEDIRLIWSGNFLRVWNEVIHVAGNIES